MKKFLFIVSFMLASSCTGITEAQNNKDDDKHDDVPVETKYDLSCEHVEEGIMRCENVEVVCYVGNGRVDGLNCFKK